MENIFNANEILDNAYAELHKLGYEITEKAIYKQKIEAIDVNIKNFGNLIVNGEKYEIDQKILMTSPFFQAMLGSKFIESSFLHQKELQIFVPNPNVFSYNLEIITKRENLNPKIFHSTSIYWRVLKNLDYFSDFEMTKIFLNKFSKLFANCEDFNFKNCDVEKLEQILETFNSDSNVQEQICVQWLTNSAMQDIKDWKILQKLGFKYVHVNSLESAKQIFEILKPIPDLFDFCIRTSHLLKVLNDKERELNQKENEMNEIKNKNEIEMNKLKLYVLKESKKFEDIDEDSSNFLDMVIDHLKKHEDISSRTERWIKNKYITNEKFHHSSIFCHSQGYSGYGYWKCCKKRDEDEIGCCVCR